MLSLFFNRRYMKFCQQCGILGRSDNLGDTHIPICQPGLKRGATGFLMCGQYSKLDVENFRIKLRLIGVAEHEGSSLVDTAPEPLPVDRTPGGLGCSENSFSPIGDEFEYVGQIDSTSP